MKEPGFRASKNPDIADRSQKATTSIDTAQNINKSRRKRAKSNV